MVFIFATKCTIHDLNTQMNAHSNAEAFGFHGMTQNLSNMYVQCLWLKLYSMILWNMKKLILSPTSVFDNECNSSTMQMEIWKGISENSMTFYIFSKQFPLKFSTEIFLLKQICIDIAIPMIILSSMYKH